MPDTSSPAAELGTRLHDLAAQVLDGAIDLDYVYEAVDKRSAEQVEIYVGYVRARHAEIGGDLHVEQRFHIALHDELWGTADAVIANASARTMEVVDLKTGGGHEVAVRNPDGSPNIQLAGYLLGALHMTDGPFDRLHLTVVQPRRGGIKTTIVTWDELLDLSGHLVAVIRAALAPDPPARPGDHCTFCRARTTCPEHAQRSLIEARGAFDAEPIPAGFAA